MNTPVTTDSPPKVSVIIPSLDGYRNGAVPRLLESIGHQTFRDYDVHMIKGVNPQGKAINQGARAARGSLLIILDDDSWLADETVFQRLVDALDSDETIGMAGASIVPPPDASPFQQRAAAQFPRFNTPVVDSITDSDLACHGCCAIPKRVFDQVGGEREDLPRGLDPDLRVRIRAAGCRVVLVPNARIHHPLPDGWPPLLRTFFRNGFGSAYARKFQPATVYETHEQLDSIEFRPRTSFAFRIVRFPIRLLKALVELKLIRFAAYCSYACGYFWGMVTAKEQILVDGTSDKTRH